MNGEYESLKPLLVGEEKTRTRVAVGLAGFLFIVGATVDYFATSVLVTGVRDTIWPDVAQAFVVRPPHPGGLLPLTWIYGYFLFIGLAAIHTYYNYGYLTSILLAIAPNMGMGLWSPRVVFSPSYNEYMSLSPMNIFEVSPEVLFVANIGFIVGLALRSVRKTEDFPPGARHAHD